MDSIFSLELLAIFPEVFLFLGLNLLLIYAVSFQASHLKSSSSLLNELSWLSIGLLGFTFILIINSSLPSLLIFKETLIVDNLSLFLKGLILLSTIACIIMAFDFFQEEKIYAFEYMLLILFSTLSMCILVSAYDFMTMYLAIELQSLCFYTLTAMKKDSEFTTEAGLKYFILGSFSSGILLFGFVLIYGFTGTTNLEVIMRLFLGTEIESTALAYSFVFNGFLIGVLFVAAGCLFKLTAVPFHMWAPDVYEGAPTSVTAFFSIVPKIALLGFMLRFFSISLFDLLFPCQAIFYICSIASLFVGAFAALGQTKIKRLLAFSSIGHVGYFLMAFACGTIEGIQALLVYFIIYLITSIGLFTSLLALKKQDSTGRIKYIGELVMLVQTNPLLAITIALAMLSTAGIPPLIGFIGKFYLFSATLNASLYSLAIIGVLTSVISCFYYIRLIQIMYFQKKKYGILYQPMDASKAFLLALIFFFLTFFFFYATPLDLLTKEITNQIVSQLPY